VRQTNSPITPGALRPSQSGNGPLGPDQRILGFAVVRELAVGAPLARPYSGAVISEKLFETNSLHENQNHAIAFSLLDERRRHAPDGKRPHSHRMGKTEGKHQKAGVVRHSRHEGLAPVRLSIWLETGSSLVKRANSCRTSDRSACLAPVLGPWPADPVFPFRAHRLAAAQTDKRRPSVRDHEKAPALPLPRKGTDELEEDQGNGTRTRAEEAAPTPPRGLLPGGKRRSDKRGLGVGVTP
jgi:hypothetical protein